MHKKPHVVLNKINVQKATRKIEQSLEPRAKLSLKLRAIDNVYDMENLSDNEQRKIAQYGTDKQRSMLIDIPTDAWVKNAVARYGNDKHRDMLLDEGRALTHDTFIFLDMVRCSIAQYGNHYHRAKLLFCVRDVHIGNPPIYNIS